MRLNRFTGWDIATCLWLGLLAILIVATATEYGDSWDEKVRSDAGQKKLTYYENLLSGNIEEAMAFASQGDNYPGFHDLNLAILKRISPFSDHTTGNLFTALLGFLGIVGTIRLARLIGTPQTGFWAGVFLTLLPAWYGHMFINPKDIPLAFGYVWALNFIYEWITSRNPPGYRVIVCCGIAMGLAMASRIGGLILLCYLALFLGIQWLILVWTSKPQSRVATFRKLLVPTAIRYLASSITALAILLLYWPGGQLKPFASASRTLATVTQYNWTMPVFFEGSFYNATDLPLYYILKMIVLKVPIIFLLLFAGTCIHYCWKYLKKKNQSAFKEGNALGVGLIIFAVLFPVLYVIVKDSILYNGMRHLLFILPPMCAIAAWGLSLLSVWMKDHRPRLVTPVGLAFILTLLLTAVQMIRLHPYQYIYYNELAGGTTGAAQRYETDYWGTVYKELAEEFYEYLVETKPTFTKPEVVVNMEHVTYLFAPFLPEETSLPIRVLRSQPEQDDYYAASTTWAADTFYAGTPVVQVQRAGTVLGMVKDRRGLSVEERALGYEVQE